jgi:hypothetical protein
LLKKLIDVHQIILGAEIWQGESVLVLRHWSTMVPSMMIDRNQLRASVHILNSTSVDWKTL